MTLTSFATVMLSTPSCTATAQFWGSRLVNIIAVDHLQRLAIRTPSTDHSSSGHVVVSSGSANDSFTIKTVHKVLWCPLMYHMDTDDVRQAEDLPRRAVRNHPSIACSYKDTVAVRGANRRSVGTSRSPRPAVSCPCTV